MSARVTASTVRWILIFSLGEGDTEDGESTAAGPSPDQDVLDIDFSLDGLADSVNAESAGQDSILDINSEAAEGIDLDFGLDFEAPSEGENTAADISAFESLSDASATATGHPDAETKTLNLNSIDMAGSALSLEDVASNVSDTNTGLDLDLGPDEEAVDNAAGSVDELQNRLISPMSISTWATTTALVKSSMRLLPKVVIPRSKRHASYLPASVRTATLSQRRDSTPLFTIHPVLNIGKHPWDSTTG